ncbi:MULTISPECIES: hypothetical protein [unclassified Microcoleus]|nr:MULTISPECIES: hypothetical protein [unclassified Microcoleus]
MIIVFVKKKKLFELDKWRSPFNETQKPIALNAKSAIDLHNHSYQ